MRNAIAVFLLAAFACDAGAVTIPTVYVGDVGNPNNPADGDQAAAGIQNYGAVNYAYRIGTYEVTNAQYVEFLNAKASSNLLGLYDEGMTRDPRGGIVRSGVYDQYTYETKPNMADKPVNFVNWYDAIRFVNWLNNGQGSGSTETGAYTIMDSGKLFPSDGPSIVRNPARHGSCPAKTNGIKPLIISPPSRAETLTATGSTPRPPTAHLLLQLPTAPATLAIQDSTSPTTFMAPTGIARMAMSRLSVAQVR